VQVRLLPGPLRKDCHRRGIPFRKRVGFTALGVRLPLLPLSRRHGRARQGSALLPRRRGDPPAGSNPAASVSFRCGRAARRATVTREAQVRALPPELHAPVVDAEMTPGSQPGSSGFDSRRGYRRTASVCGGVGHPAGFGNRRSLVRLQPDRLRGRGVAVLASLMSSRPWVRIPPALCNGDVAQRPRALGCRPRSAGSSPVVPASWWPWCNGKHPGL
jgi:hypothetical protein